MARVTGEWGCGSECGISNTQKWGPNSIYEIECKKCGTKVEFFKDEKKRTCPNCGEKVFNETVGEDCC
jgi:DNA-directed RNA polymerase subunit RPC12/RpoP